VEVLPRGLGKCIGILILFPLLTCFRQNWYIKWEQNGYTSNPGSLVPLSGSELTMRGLSISQPETLPSFRTTLVLPCPVNK
jgi:hypothetical protein